MAKRWLNRFADLMTEIPRPPAEDIEVAQALFAAFVTGRPLASPPQVNKVRPPAEGYPSAWSSSTVTDSGLCGASVRATLGRMPVGGLVGFQIQGKYLLMISLRVKFMEMQQMKLSMGLKK